MAEEKITNISLSKKKCFSIDSDYNRLIYLDTSDMNVLVRLEEVYQSINELAQEAVAKISAIPDDKDDGEQLSDLAQVLKEIDAKMREKIDYIFDDKVSDACVPKGNMYDPYEGGFRFEHVVSTLTGLYANDIADGFKKMQDNVKKHTAKYTKSSASKRNRK